MRPFLPPSLDILASGNDTAERISAEDRIRDTAFEAGRQRGFEEGQTAGLEEGQRIGRTEGRVQAEVAFAARERDGASAAAASFAKLLAAREQDRCALDAEMRATLTAALQALMPALSARAEGVEAIAVAAEALRDRAPEVLAIKACPATLAAMQAEGFPAPDEAARIRLDADPMLPTGVVEVTWAGGGLRRDPQDIAARVLAVLGARAVTPNPEKE